MSRIIIADHHGLYRTGFRSIVTGALPGTEVVDADCSEAMLEHIAQQTDISAVFVDPSLPGMVSLKTVAEAQNAHPHVFFVIISASDSRADALRCIAAGLHGFISKLQQDEEIIAAVKDILSGRIYVPPSLAPTLAEGQSRRMWDGFPAIEATRDVPKLTRRQREVLPLIARGLSNKEIARKLNIAEATTKIHAAGLLRVLGARNRTEAAVMAQTILDSTN